MMNTYIKFLVKIFLKFFLNIFLVMTSLVFILNILKEIEFFSDKNVNALYPVYLSLMSSPSIIFEMFPFIFLISTQFFFIKLLNNNEIDIFKYSGLNNLKIIKVLSALSLFLGFLIIIFFYNISSNLQSYYLELKNQYSKDKTYLAVINKNGLWIKDIYEDKISIINSAKIENNFLKETIITTFDKNYNPIRNIKSDKIDIRENNWLVHDASIIEKDVNKNINLYKFETNFNLKMIESLFSNLSSLSIIKLVNLRNNYNSLNYSIVDVDIQIYKIFTFPIFLMLMTIFSSIIMFNTKNFKSNSFKIVIGLFFSVTIYYITNFFNVMGSTEKIPLTFAIWTPLIFLSIINVIMLTKINEK